MKRIIFAAALLAAAAGARAASSLDEGMRLMTERKYPEAVSALEREEHANPGSPEVLLNLGWAYWHARRIDDARRVGATLIKLDPENTAFMVFLANTEIEKKDYAAAAALMEKALRLAPGDRDASMVLSRADFGLKRDREGLALLEEVIAKYPDFRIARYRKAMFLFERGRKQEALGVLDKLIAADPKNQDYRRSRAQILADLGRSQEAKAVWTDLVKKEPDAGSLMNLGWAYWREKNFDEAYKIAVLLVKLDDQNPNFLRFKANMEMEKLNYPEALKLAQKALKLVPGDKNAALTVAKALFRLQREKEAMAVFKDLIDRFPADAAVQYHWAQFCARMGYYDESLFYADKLIKADPSNPSYRVTRSEVLYEMGRFDEAVAEWRLLASQDPPSAYALRRLRDDAFDRMAYDEADAWQEKIIALDPANSAAWEKLARIDIMMKDHAKALAALEKAIEVDPIPMSPYYAKAETLEALGDLPASQKAFQYITEQNPNSIRAFEGMSFVLEAEGKYPDAMAAVRRNQRLITPSVSPYLRVHEARLLANSGRFSRAHAMLKELIRDRRTVIPVLLYHGLSRFDRSDSISQDAFRSQMAALKAKGYHPLTVSELDRAFRGLEPLPKKPLLITFDDARTDSFEYADPVLKEMGFRATMFVHLSKLRKPHFHASPEDVRKWQATGRWEMQAHGYEAHDPMPLDGEGRMGHFLPNRRWLAEKNRLETLAEYRTRLDGEYRRMKQGLEEIIPGEVIAFAYPYGDYGQNDYSNTPEAAALNQELVRKYFRLAFVQERFGINTLASNPTDLRRFEVTRHMTAKQLINHLALSDPRAQAELLDADLYIRANQPGRAAAIFKELENDGVSQPAVWADEGSGMSKAGNVYAAQRLFERAYDETPNKGDPGADLYGRLVEQGKAAAAPNVGVEAQGFTDSDTNDIEKVFVRAGASIKALRLSAWAGEARYADKLDPAGSPLVRGKEGGVQLRGFAGDRLELSGFYSRRSFTEGASWIADNYQGSAALQLLPQLNVAVRDGMGNVETAPAVRARRTFHSDGAGLTWDPFLNWKANADFDYFHYNDSNIERDLRLRLTKKFSEGVSVGASWFHGDSATRAPSYYTPRGLNQYTGLLTLNRAFGEPNLHTGLPPAEAMIQYEGGYGTQASGSRATHAVRAGVSLRLLTRVTLTLDGQYSQSPTYVSRRADGGVSISF